jgi:hypothetical protein
MVYPYKHGHDRSRGPGGDGQIGPGTDAPLRRPPDYRGSEWVRPAGGIKTYFALEIFLGRCRPTSVGLVYDSRSHIYLLVDARRERHAIGQEPQGRRTPVRIIRRPAVKSAGKNKMGPARRDLVALPVLPTVGKCIEAAVLCQVARLRTWIARSRFG